MQKTHHSRHDGFGGFHLIVAHHRQALLPTLTRAQQVPMGWGGTGKVSCETKVQVILLRGDFF